MRVVIINCVTLNGGDAAILYSLRKLLYLAFGDDIEIAVFDHQAEVAQRYYRDINFRQMYLNTIPASAKNIHLAKAQRRMARLRWLVGLALAHQGKHELGQRLAPSSLRSHWQAYRDADLIVSTGGTYLVENYDVLYRVLHLLTAAACRRPLILFTQSLGPFNMARSRRALRWLLRQIDLLLLRDARSARHIAALGAAPMAADIVADGVFALADEEHLRQAAERPLAPVPRIAVSVRAWRHFAHDNESTGMARYCASIAAAVTYLVREKGAKVTFISTCQGIPEYWTNDSATAECIYNILPDDIRRSVTINNNFHSTDELICEFSKFDLVLATRMHAAILSLIAGTPVIPIAYEFKTQELFKQLGWGEWVLDIDTLDGEKLVSHLARLLPQLPDLKPQLFQNVIACRRSALRAVPLMREAVERARLSGKTKTGR